MSRARYSDLIFWLWTACWIAYCAFGCAPAPYRAGRCDRDYLAWSANISQGQGPWLAKARRRFRDPFVFVCHGDTSDGMSWWVAPDDRRAEGNIEIVGKLLHEMLPQRDVVLVSCNAAGVKPHLPRRVWYSTTTVWSLPQSAYPLPVPNWACGSIWDFVEGDGT